jgi:hypothetical protein
MVSGYDSRGADNNKQTLESRNNGTLANPSPVRLQSPHIYLFNVSTDALHFPLGEFVASVEYV